MLEASKTGRHFLTQIIGRDEARQIGRKRYFGGKPCKRGHIAERYVRSNLCVECSAEQVRRGRLDCPEKWREYGRRAGKIKYERHRDKILAEQRIYREKNKNKIRARRLRWQKENLKRRVAYNKAWRQKNQSRSAEHGRAWRSKNPAKVREKVRRRQAAQMQRTPGWVDHSATVRFYEEAERITAQSGVKHHVDHIVPLQGKNVCGLHVPWNLRVVPARENIAKGCKLIEELIAP